jgi:hypothetical protein
MNYKNIYNSLIEKGKSRTLEEYTEIHHIIPKCMGGSDTEENLVKLTPEEHYLAHQLLVKIYPNNILLVNAAVMMIPNRPSNKLYGWLRRRHQQTMSKLQTGEGNSQYGTTWIYHIESRVSKKIPKNEKIPPGWTKGRIVDFDSYFKKIEEKSLKKEKIKKTKILSKEESLKKIKTKHFMFKKTEGYRRAKSCKLYKEFTNSNMSLRKFAKSKNMIPMTLSKWFREFVVEYDIVARKSANEQI